MNASGLDLISRPFGAARSVAAGKGLEMTQADGPLAGIRVLDLTRVLAGPVATQLLGDLGADVVKVERPNTGDDTRAWGPPYLKNDEGEDTAESAYFLSCNRNKRSLSVDLATSAGRELVRALAGRADVLIENFKVGDMVRFGLAYADLAPMLPRLVYCSISGFGQTGPYAAQRGYDFMVQGLGGVMSITGEPEGAPMKVGVAVADVVCGLYAGIAILAALRHRDEVARAGGAGGGQHIDVGLLDTQVAWLVNQGLNYLVSGEPPRRLGNAHPNIVPYQVFAAADGYLIVAVGNDGQFRRLAECLSAPGLADDSAYTTNAARVRHRDTLVPILEALIRAKPRAHWLDGLSVRGVPCGPVNAIDQVFADPQVQAREMRITMAHPLAAGGEVDLIGNPLKLSISPVAYRRPPPTLGQHTDEVLAEWLGLSAEQCHGLRVQRAI
jgi:crotonobetainyl-CoA:carnitine CoA-transferase CaiB-like acyl-CoA transferase